MQTEPSFLLLFEDLLLLEGGDAIFETFVHGGWIDGGIVLLLCLLSAVHCGGVERGTGCGGGLGGEIWGCGRGEERGGRSGARWRGLGGTRGRERLRNGVGVCAIHGKNCRRRGGGPVRSARNAGNTKAESVNVLQT